MDNAEGGRADKRRPDTERQMDMRERDRVCGWCGTPHKVELIEWYGSSNQQPLLIAMCEDCVTRLETSRRS